MIFNDSQHWEREWGGGLPLSSRLRGLRERRKLPGGVRGGAPAENEFWRIFELKNTPDRHKSYHF